MLSLNAESCELFNIPFYQFAQMKKFCPEDIPALKANYKLHWDNWKAIIQEVAKQLGMPFAKPHIESWTNGWKIRDHFWTCYRIGDVNPCIGVLVNRQQLQVYLMFQNYKSETRLGTSTQYQSAVNQQLANWQRTVNSTEYYVWTASQSELEPHQRLDQYQESDEPLMIGKVWYFPLAAEFNFEQEVSKAVSELLPLYREVIGSLEVAADE